MESSTKEITNHVLDSMMQHEELEPESRRITRGTVIILSTLAVFLIGAVIAIMGFVDNAQSAKEAKHQRMESIASTFSEGQAWEQVKNEKPSDNSKGWLVQEWLVTSQSEVQTATENLGIVMSDVAYRAGCKEGNDGELIVQVCSSPSSRTLSLVIGE